MRGSWRAFLEVPGGLSAGRYPSDQWEESVEFELDLKFSILLLSGRGAVWDGEGPGVLTDSVVFCLLPVRICFQEQEKEARSRAAYISTLPAPSHWGRGFDEDKDEDEGSPGGCNPAGGNGDFHRLVF